MTDNLKVGKEQFRGVIVELKIALMPHHWWSKKTESEPLYQLRMVINVGGTTKRYQIDECPTAYVLKCQRAFEEKAEVTFTMTNNE